MTFTRVDHQFSLFSAAEMRPKMKVPISAARISQVKALIDAGKGEDAARVLREVNDRLDDFGKRKFGKNWE